MTAKVKLKVLVNSGAVYSPFVSVRTVVLGEVSSALWCYAEDIGIIMMTRW
jgi:hypothetical protein